MSKLDTACNTGIDQGLNSSKQGFLDGQVVKWEPKSPKLQYS